MSVMDALLQLQLQLSDVASHKKSSHHAGRSPQSRIATKSVQCLSLGGCESSEELTHQEQSLRSHSAREAFDTAHQYLQQER